MDEQFKVPDQHRSGYRGIRRYGKTRYRQLLLHDSVARAHSPQVGFSVQMRRVRARVSTSMGGRPTGRRDRRRQSSFHKERCQRMTVAGRTMGTAATSDGNSLVMALVVKRSRGLRRGWGAALWRRMTCCLSKVFSATSAARERSVSRSVASTAFVTSRSIGQEYPAVCSRPGSLRHEHRQDPRHFQVRSEYLRRTGVSI